MLLDTLINIFIRQHYFESIYEITTRRGDSYAEIAVDTQDEYFYCSFCVLDAQQRMFTVFCEHNTGRSFAYRMNKDNVLLDIKRELFSAREILMHNVNDLEALQEIDVVLSDPHNVDLFYENLTFRRGKFGNEWFVQLAPPFDEPQLENVFLVASKTGMLWNNDASRFLMHNGHEKMGQSVIECSHGVVSINNYILFMVLNPGVRFNLVQFIPLKNSVDTIVCEGEIEIPHSLGEGSEKVYCKFTVTNLDRLPTTNIIVRIKDEVVEGKTPILILNSPENGMLHSTLRKQSIEAAVDEMIEIVKEYVPRKCVQSHLEHLNRVCERWNVSATKQIPIFTE